MKSFRQSPQAAKPDNYIMHPDFRAAGHNGFQYGGHDDTHRSHRFARKAWELAY